MFKYVILAVVAFALGAMWASPVKAQFKPCVWPNTCITK